VVTGHPPDHGPFEELAAGYVLDALEPADEQRFLLHAEQCQECSRVLAGFREVAAALADTLARTAPRAEPRPELGERILAAVRADLDRGSQAAPPPAGPGRPGPEDTAAGPPDRAAGPGDAAPPAGDALPPGVVRVRPAGRPWLRPAAAAAAVALIAGGGVWAGLAATAAHPPPSSCAHVRGCTEIALTAGATHGVAARVIVSSDTAYLLPGVMTANPADKIYVLWQITKSGRVLALGSFDVHAGAHGSIKVGALGASLSGTQYFGVSLEPGRTIPRKPSHVVALGHVT